MKTALALGLMVAGFWWWRSDPDVEKGNAKVADGKFEDALSDYERAAKVLPEEEQQQVLSFDKGVALHGAGKLEEARKAFAAAAQSPDPALRSRAAFNEGNVATALKDKPGAVDGYIRSLQADPSFEPARRNLEILLAEPPPPPQDGGSPPDGGGGDGGPGDGGGGGDGGQGGDGGSGQDGGSPDQPPQQPPPQQVNQQDAMKLLDAMREAEKHRPLGRIMLRDDRPVRSNKDW